MQKALTEMNLQLHHVVTDITGVTGLRILRALVAGERDPDQLAAYRDPRCKAPAETLRAALVGNYREEHVFALAQVADGARQIMAYLVPSDFCDLHVLILKAMDHSIATLSYCTVVKIPRQRILELTERPAIARALWWAALVDEATLREW